jgi:hypothetical protein
MATVATIKFAGPDNNDRFKCLSVKGRLVVDPGKLYKRRTIEYFNRNVHGDKYDVSTIEPKFDTHRRVFTGPKGDDL